MQPLCLTSLGCKKGSTVVELGTLRQITLTCTTIKILRDSYASKPYTLLHYINFVL